MRNTKFLRLSILHDAYVRVMSQVTVSLFLVAVVLALTNPVMAGSNKIEVCHIPPGNPDNFHTITISENALAAHLSHGDIEGSCNAFCATLCDDGNACTIDDNGDCDHGCPVPQAVDCDDGQSWSVDSCDPVEGCQYVSLCPCWNGESTAYNGHSTLAELWAAEIPDDCSEGNSCTDFGNSSIKISRASCEPESQGFLETQVNCDPDGDTCSSGSCIVVAESEDNEVVSLSLDGDTAALCIAEHDAFTAGGTFPSYSKSPCGLPFPCQ